MKGTIRQQIETLKSQLRPETVLVAAVRDPDPSVEPTWVAIGGSDEAKSQAIEEARRRWRAEHVEKSDGS